jgi:hypothetical protein
MTTKQENPTITRTEVNDQTLRSVKIKKYSYYFVGDLEAIYGTAFLRWADKYVVKMSIPDEDRKGRVNGQCRRLITVADFRQVKKDHKINPRTDMKVKVTKAKVGRNVRFEAEQLPLFTTSPVIENKPEPAAPLLLSEEQAAVIPKAVIPPTQPVKIPVKVSELKKDDLTLRIQKVSVDNINLDTRQITEDERIERAIFDICNSVSDMKKSVALAKLYAAFDEEVARQMEASVKDLPLVGLGYEHFKKARTHASEKVNYLSKVRAAGKIKVMLAIAKKLFVA